MSGSVRLIVELRRSYRVEYTTTNEDGGQSVHSKRFWRPRAALAFARKKSGAVELVQRDSADDQMRHDKGFWRFIRKTWNQSSLF